MNFRVHFKSSERERREVKCEMFVHIFNFLIKNLVSEKVVSKMQIITKICDFTLFTLM